MSNTKEAPAISNNGNHTKGNNSHKLSQFICASAMALMASWCSSLPPERVADNCRNPEFTASLNTTLGQKEELVKMKTNELNALRKEDHKGNNSGNSDLRIWLSGEIGKLKHDIQLIKAMLRTCHQRPSYR